MNKNRNLEYADIFAPEYDTEVPANGWCAPEIIFNLMSKYILPGEMLLDIGIGTGLSSLPFNKAGLLIHGIDGSIEMIKICESKKIAIKLERCDFNRDFLPYKDSIFNHVISSGVFHLLGDLSKLFGDISRILRNDGLFCFTVDDQIKGTGNPESILCKGSVLEYTNPKSRIKTYYHREEYITDLLIKNNLTVLKKQTFLAYEKTEWSDDIFFNVYLTKK